ncbi:MAG: hypothetical protein HZA12_06355 [Nitrospirae bacterium]|nr:hypothetical protein [Nitrospirota bacterium]
MHHKKITLTVNNSVSVEVEAIARGEEIGAPVKDKQEILNCLAAMSWIWNGKTSASINESDLLHLHRILTRKVLPDEQSGHYKTRPNRIVDHRGLTIYTLRHEIAIDRYKEISGICSASHPLMQPFHFGGRVSR